MSASPRLDAALARLSSALSRLDAAAERRARVDAARADRDEEFLVLQDDRARLAVDLDGALSRLRALAGAHDDVSARLDRAGETVRAVLNQFAVAEAPPEPGLSAGVEAAAPAPRSQ